MSYELKIDPKKRAASRFIGKVRKALILAALDEKEASGVNQQKLAVALGVNRSVINRMLKAESNLTLRSVGELAWALGYEPEITMKRKVAPAIASNHPVVIEKPVATSTRHNVAIYSRAQSQAFSHLEAAE